MNNALSPLVAGLVDYAGLFPPAALPLPEVVSNYHQYVQSNALGMLGRLIIPAGRLSELIPLFPEGLDEAQPWHISALIPPVEEDDDAAAAGLEQIASFNHSADVAGRALVDTVEVRVAQQSGLTQLAERLTGTLAMFVEVDWREDPEPWMAELDSLAEAGLRAKIRTGGVTQDLIPPPQAVAQFLLAAGRHRVGLKATAGLHHPLTGEYRLTYEPDADNGTMFGFINVFVAGLRAFDRPDSAPDSLIAILNCRRSDEFRITPTSIGFDDWELAVDQIETFRQSSLLSFGSCSFTEPTTELPTSFGISSS